MPRNATPSTFQSDDSKFPATATCSLLCCWEGIRSRAYWNWKVGVDKSDFKEFLYRNPVVKFVGVVNAKEKVIAETMHQLSLEINGEFKPVGQMSMNLDGELP
ncbi:hypothetical protein HID58_092427 [Brassica napus]|uniref:Cysteine proteinase inhibitor n=1 Tax=Brassica napus TaxID=3708 RepID=A0ABQ7WWI4_BRANA|nr:hypothetical protein HID58_092427 [Brassica napus]